MIANIIEDKIKQDSEREGKVIIDFDWLTDFANFALEVYKDDDDNFSKG